ncbi:type VII secretion-associated serine protease mycosin [Streptomyces caniscabiei]|uniref:Type VII secretion-associated serine protease mycosin n=1 Tax=Streptomyces caniscabiei TaxID=2746961 RepID=A0ABU4N4N4_9ACTN|nr:type VII secretion-associated serine protease mycosin [Streptomyces caniscabiei]MBE4741791.1 type VII secretion-associated serine protease mycosin [Streptomyces caniscabiei]MBE4762469.1 type VII secretion-associated serine protease mycosin [Streptomyces caniscabiei]MBE4775771.1 type VII secretion-associated serine protease mycosin [Streptomyces caniscabiei]MBE4790557.1 type VII secretion-associated serine protease mycosin [Streptomyces caniscabiei]MBE4796291.1 type VII secretion-associated 
MLSSSKRTLWPVSALSAVLGLLLVGITATAAQAESIRARQWHLDAMHAEEMWKVSTGRGITVAVIDTGVDNSLADLKGQVLDGQDYSGLKGDEHTDADGHGTNMAALIAATGGRGSLNGSYGLAPGAKILPVRLALSNGESFENIKSGSAYAAQMSTAIRYAAKSEAQIINISGGSFKEDANTPELASSVKYALQKGKLIFAAAGNEGDRANLPGYPAAIPGVVAVASINEKIERSSFSQSGPQIDIAAPGEDMLSACGGGTQICMSDGTSSSTAIASASAALIWSKHPTWTGNQVLRVLINTMKGNEKKWTWNNAIGYGIVRPRVALQSPGDPGPADKYPLPDLAAVASASPSPEAPKPGGSPDDSKATDRADDTHSAASTSGDGNTALWVGLGIGFAGLLGTAITVAMIRTRSQRSSALAAPAVAPEYTQQPAEYPHQNYGTYGPPQGVSESPYGQSPGPGPSS